jgi:ACS family pantothenate transporter-like MFS transporter
MVAVEKRKEDLHMYGNELNYAVTAWTAGYIVGQIPSNIVITRVRPSIWLPTLEVRNGTVMSSWQLG